MSGWTHAAAAEARRKLRAQKAREAVYADSLRAGGRQPPWRFAAAFPGGTIATATGWRGPGDWREKQASATEADEEEHHRRPPGWKPRTSASPGPPARPASLPELEQGQYYATRLLLVREGPELATSAKVGELQAGARVFVVDVVADAMGVERALVSLVRPPAASSDGAPPEPPPTLGWVSMWLLSKEGHEVHNVNASQVGKAGGTFTPQSAQRASRDAGRLDAVYNRCARGGPFAHPVPCRTLCVCVCAPSLRPSC